MHANPELPSLTFQRFGFGMKDGFACYHSSAIQPAASAKRHPDGVPSTCRCHGPGEQRLGLDCHHKGVELFEAKGVVNGGNGTQNGGE